MKIKLNSVETDIPDNATVNELKRFLNLSGGGVAVAVNGKIVLAPRHDTHRLSEGDDVILIGAAYGG